MHETVIMYGCIIVFMLDYIIIQHGSLKKDLYKKKKSENVNSTQKSFLNSDYLKGTNFRGRKKIKKSHFAGIYFRSFHYFEFFAVIIFRG